MKDKIILGTAQFGLNYGINNKVGYLSEKEVFEILNLSRQRGIKYLDTAAAYGTSEERIGKYIKLNKCEEEFKVITKYKLSSVNNVIESLEKSLISLAVNQVDTLMFHSIEDFRRTSDLEIEKLLMHKGNKFKNLGISIYRNEEALEICELGLFDIIQMPFNALDNYNKRGEILKILNKKGIHTHTRSVFLQGLFFMASSSIPSILKPLIPYFNNIDTIAKDFGISRIELALLYALNIDYIDGVLVGVESYKQLESNLNILELNYCDDIFNAINSITVSEEELLNPTLWNI